MQKQFVSFSESLEKPVEQDSLPPTHTCHSTLEGGQSSSPTAALPLFETTIGVPGCLGVGTVKVSFEGVQLGPQKKDDETEEGDERRE